MVERSNNGSGIQNLTQHVKLTRYNLLELISDDCREQAMLGNYIESIANYKRIFSTIDK